MKTKLLITGLLLLLLVTPAITSAKSDYDTVVVGTGDPSVDVPAVQAAVDAGGSILLKGTFDFGEERVLVLTDGVIIAGEKDNKGNHLTKIQNGTHPFLIGQNVPGSAVVLYDHGGNYPGFPDTIEPVSNVTIRDLHLENPIFTAIVASGVRDRLTIVGNKITGLRAKKVTFPAGVYSALGLYIGSNPGYYDHTLVSGEILIEGNYIDGQSAVYETPDADPDALLAQGLYWRGITWGMDISHADAKFYIRNNTVINVLDSALRVTNFITYSEIMAVQIEDNYLAPGNVGYYDGTMYFFGDGIGNLGVSSLVLTKNTIHTTNPMACPIFTQNDADHVVITKNDITAEGAPYGAIAVFEDSTADFIGQNTIKGYGHVAIWLWPGAEQNVMQGNNVTGFTPIWSHYGFLGANYNLVVGNGGTVLDFGVENVITGLTPLAGGVGEELSQAIQTKKEIMSLYE